MGDLLGLDYAGVLATAKMLDMDVDWVMLRKIQILESYELGQKQTPGDGMKPCRNANACAMCAKVCDQRIG